MIDLKFDHVIIICMKNQKNQKIRYEELKEQETTGHKICSFLHRLFIKEEKFSPQISRAAVAATYFQILELMNVIALFTVFSNTNSQLYSIVVSMLCVVLFLIDIIPKVSKKHLIFYFVSITEGLVIAGIMIGSRILLNNHLIFQNYCNDFQIYHANRVNQNVETRNSVLQMCTEIELKFAIEIIVEGAFVLGKIIHLILYIRAYKRAKEKFDEEEKKRRRKDRYNQMMRKRNIFNEKRKV